MNCVAMERLLNCSPSSIRNYIRQLLRAGVVVQATPEKSENARQKDYRLTVDAIIVDNFLEGLGTPQLCKKISVVASHHLHMSLGDARYFHFLGVTDIGSCIRERSHIRRDPLVAALFGSASVAD